MHQLPKLAFFAPLSFILFAASPAKAALSEEDFRNPPIQARPAALWTWLNGYVDGKQITRELEEMKAKGMRGAIIWDLGSIADPQKIIPAAPRVPRDGIAEIHPPCDGRGGAARAGAWHGRGEQLELRRAVDHAG